MRTIGMGILAMALVTGCAFSAEDDTVAPGTKHQLAGGNGSGDVADSKTVIPSTSGGQARGERPRPPPPPGDPEPSPWKFTPSGEPEPSPWNGGMPLGPETTNSDPTQGHRDAKLTQGVLDQH